MATKSTLEALVVAQKAAIEQMQAQMQALMTAQANMPVKPAKPAKPPQPLVSRGYFKTQGPDGKWVDDTSRPCIVVALPGAKPRKCKPETLEAEIANHAKIAAAYKALA